MTQPPRLRKQTEEDFIYELVQLIDEYLNETTVDEMSQEAMCLFPIKDVLVKALRVGRYK